MIEEIGQSVGSSSFDRGSKHIFASPSTMMLYQFSKIAKFNAHKIAATSAWVGVNRE